MGVRKSTDYSSMFALLDAMLDAELPLIKLYYEIGRIVSSSPEKGAAIATAEYLQNACPDAAGFSPRNLRRMRAFYQAYASTPEMIDAAMEIGWTQNVIILEAKLTTTEKEWYIRAVGQFGWSKSELLRQIEAEAHLTLDLPDKVCYTEENAVAEEDSSYAQDHQCHRVGSSGAADGISALLSLLRPQFLYRGVPPQPLLVCNGRGRPVGVAYGTGPPGRGGLWQAVFQEGWAGQQRIKNFKRDLKLSPVGPRLIFDAIHVIIRCIPQDRFESIISDKMFKTKREKKIKPKIL